METSSMREELIQTMTSSLPPVPRARTGPSILTDQ